MPTDYVQRYAQPDGVVGRAPSALAASNAAKSEEMEDAKGQQDAGGAAESDGFLSSSDDEDS